MSLSSRLRSLGAVVGVIAFGVVSLGSGGCTKPQPDGASTSPSTSGSPNSSAAPSSSASSQTDASAEPTAKGGAKAASYDGKYATTAVTMIAVPDGVKWKGEESPDGVGEGKLALEVSAEGRVQGTIEGALGAALVEGTVDGDTLTATFRRKDPTDNGFYGTLGGKIAADKIEGTLTSSRGNAGLVREGKFSLAKK